MSHPFNIWSGLVEPKHITAMGLAVWTYLWCLSKVTADCGDRGVVLYGRPIAIRSIADNFGISERQVRRHIHKLKMGGYIKTQKKLYGLVIWVTKNKNFTEDPDINVLIQKDPDINVLIQKDPDINVRTKMSARLENSQEKPELLGVNVLSQEDLRKKVVKERIESLRGITITNTNTNSNSNSTYTNTNTISNSNSTYSDSYGKGKGNDKGNSISNSNSTYSDSYGNDKGNSISNSNSTYSDSYSNDKGKGNSISLFATFWAEYPNWEQRKSKKQLCKIKLEKLPLQTQEKVMAALKNMLAILVRDNKKEYIQMTTTFLNDWERWLPTETEETKGWSE